MGGGDLRIDLNDSTIPPDKLHGIRHMSGEVAKERAGGDDRLHTEFRISALEPSRCGVNATMSKPRHNRQLMAVA
ncbi:hypothetical protein GCM10019060_35380 [Novosphingobium pokkalii]|nr:hypothetical protein GCM10019060_35380 [Novosphingobium pokkalii]